LRILPLLLKRAGGNLSGYKRKAQLIFPLAALIKFHRLSADASTLFLSVPSDLFHHFSYKLHDLIETLRIM